MHKAAQGLSQAGSSHNLGCSAALPTPKTSASPPRLEAQQPAPPQAARSPQLHRSGHTFALHLSPPSLSSPLIQPEVGFLFIF